MPRRPPITSLVSGPKKRSEGHPASRASQRRAWRIGRPIVPLLLLSTWSAASVLAQDSHPAVDPDHCIAEADGVARRVEREWVCVRHEHEEIQRAVALMREAREQMRSGTSAAVRRDASEAIRSLHQRIVGIERDLLACREPVSAAARGDAPPEGVVYRDAPRDPRAESVARPNPATRVLERDILLVGNVRALRGEQVDGRGHVPDEWIRGAVRAAASGIDRCYGRMVDRGALRRGRLVLTFTVTPAGHLTHILTEGSSFRDAGFLRCVRGAARTVRVAGGANGGDATFSYVLQLPAT